MFMGKLLSFVDPFTSFVDSLEDIKISLQGVQFFLLKWSASILS